MRNGNKYEKNQRKWTSIHYQRSMGRNDLLDGVEGKLHGHGCGLKINKVSSRISRGKPLLNWIQSVSVPHFLLSKSTINGPVATISPIFTTLTLFLPNPSLLFFLFLFLLQPSQKTFRTKRTLAVKLKQNKPIPHWIRLRTDSTIRYNAKRRHWRRTKLGI